MTVGSSPRPSALRSARFWARSMLVLLLLLALALVPIPWIVFSESSPRPIDRLVAIEGAPRELSGDLLASSAGFRRATPLLALWALADPSRDLIGVPDADEHRPVTVTASALEESVALAATVALRMLGQHVQITSDGLEVIAVAANRAVAAEIAVGDILLRADHKPLLLPSDLRRLAVEHEPGDIVTFDRLRNGVVEQVDVLLDMTDDHRKIEVTTAASNARVTYPAGISIEPVDVEADGGSAGLTMAVAIIDRFADEPLLNGRTVTGTGSIDLGGNVSPINGIAQKIRAAEARGVDVFLAPAAQLGDALAASSGVMEIVGVATVADAVAALRTS